MKTLKMRNFKNVTLSLAGSLLITLPLFSASNVIAADIDWGKVESKSVTTVYAGVSSWEFMKNKDHGTGQAVMKKGKKSCAECHVNKEGKFDINADKIITGELKKLKSKKPFEQNPIQGVSGFKDVGVQVAYDVENIHMRFIWSDTGTGGEQPAKLSVQFSNKLKPFRLYGCYIACHDDQIGMPKGIGKDKKLYGHYTHRKGEVKPQEKLDKYLSKGQFIDLWLASLEGDKVTLTDQYVLQDRIDDQNDLSATATFKDGEYTVVISRKLNSGDPKDIAFSDGAAFEIGIAVHHRGREGLQHYSSFPVSVGLSAEADISAMKL